MMDDDIIFGDDVVYPLVPKIPSQEYFDERLVEVRSWSHEKAFLLDIEKFDAELGGVNPGEICVITGSQGSMKTSLVLNGVERSLRIGQKVFFVSLDMDAGEIQERRALARTNYSQSFYHVCLQTGDDLEILRARDDIFETDRDIFYLYGRDKIGDIDAVVDMAHRIMPDVLVIDYLTLLRKGNQSDLMCVNDVMPRLKNLTQQLKMRTILLSQMGRASKTEQATGKTGGHGKGGGIVEELCHIEIELIKDASEDPRRPMIIATVTKNRHGASGIPYRLEVNAESMHFLGGAERVWSNKPKSKPLFVKERPVE